MVFLSPMKPVRLHSGGADRRTDEMISLEEQSFFVCLGFLWLVGLFVLGLFWFWFCLLWAKMFCNLCVTLDTRLRMIIRKVLMIKFWCHGDIRVTFTVRKHKLMLSFASFLWYGSFLFRMVLALWTWMYYKGNECSWILDVNIIKFTSISKRGQYSLLRVDRSEWVLPKEFPVQYSS